MDATLILERLREAGVQPKVAGDKLLLSPGSRIPPHLDEEIRCHKSDILRLLSDQRFSLKYAENQEATDKELTEISERLESERCVLLWSRLLNDRIAFYQGQEGG